MTDGLTVPWPDDSAAEDAEDTWQTIIPDQPRGGQAFAALHTAERAMIDALAGAALPDDVAAEVTARLGEIAMILAEHQVPEHDRWDGWRPDLPGRGHALLPPYRIVDEGERWLRATVSFGRFYLGGNGAVHGGAQPLLFDDLLGRVANHYQEGVARTAYLKVNYRLITPIDVELVAEVSLDKVEGRKRWCSGTLTDPAGRVVADVEALFLQLLPGQQ
jgi:hypothetical protein